MLSNLQIKMILSDDIILIKGTSYQVKVKGGQLLDQNIISFATFTSDFTFNYQKLILEEK